MISKSDQQVTLYRPRNNDVVWNELNSGIIPLELKERFNLIDSAPETILKKIREIIQKIVQLNDLQPDYCNILIQLSADTHANAATITTCKQPFMYFTLGLLNGLQSEDELAGVIGHELGHILLNKANELNHDGSKVNETAADNLGVKLIATAGYDPRGCIYFIENNADADSHLINSNDICQMGSLLNQIDVMQKLIDHHPADLNRIRAMETTITGLLRSGDIREFRGQPTKLPAEFFTAIQEISHVSIFDQALNNINYKNMSPLEKLKTVASILNESYPPKNHTDNDRITKIIKLISELKVDFTDEEQTEAFKKLTDIVIQRHPDTEDTIFTIQNIYLNTALSKVWVDGGKNPETIGRAEDLNQKMDEFVHAQTQEQAEQAANQIKKLTDTYKFEMGGLFTYLKKISTFKLPTELEIRESFKKHHHWTPQYSKHITWSRSSESIKNVLLSMEITIDPFVAETLGKANSSIPNMHNSSHREKDFLFFKYFTRSADGSVVDIVLSTPEFNWKELDENASEAEIIRLHTRLVEEKAAYEEEILKSVDWSLLRTDFVTFIHRYGMLLKHYYSLVPVKYPFAQSFFKELSIILLEKDEIFQSLVADFFASSYTSNPKTAYRYFDIFNEDYLKLQDVWAYENVNPPALTHMDDPFIQFLLNSSVNYIIDKNKIVRFLLETPGFFNPDPNKKLKEIFKIPWTDIFGMQSKHFASLNEIFAASNNNKELPNIFYAVELERITYEMQDSITLREFERLNIEAFWLLDTTLKNKCNFLTFLTELKMKVLVRVTNSHDAFQFLSDFRYGVAHNLFDVYSNGRELILAQLKTIILELETSEQRIAFLKELFRPEIYGIFSSDPKYDGYIPDSSLRDWCILKYTQALRKKLEEDDGSTAYYDKVKEVVDDIIANTQGFTQMMILTVLANQLNAQKKLAYYIRDSVKKHALAEALSNRYTSILAELFMNECAHDEQLRTQIINFLTNPCTVAGTEALSTYLNATYPKLRDSINLTNDNTGLLFTRMLNDFHQNFRSASLEVKTVYLETILFPIGSSEEQQKTILSKLVLDIFPIKNAQDDNNIAQLIVTAYLNAAAISEQRLLATAMVVANIREEGAKDLSLGIKLSRVLSNMGPAGGKLLQAIHSHPKTPPAIKADLVSSKTQFSKPTRWAVVELVDNCGLLERTDSNTNPVTYIGKVVGSGSFGITVFNKLADGNKVADTFLVENAAIRAEREFIMMEHAADEIIRKRPEMLPIKSMIQEGRRSAIAETDMGLAEKANHLAEQAYEQFSLIQIGAYQFTNVVAPFIARGAGFKRIGIANGLHFHQYDNDEDDGVYKKHLAKAVIVTQLSLRLSGINTDLDRHGGNILAEGSVITHFDFGAMNLEPITPEDKIATGRVLAQAIYATTEKTEGSEENVDFASALLMSIQNIQVSDTVRVYLNGLNKDFLALGDYVNALPSDEVPPLLAFCLTANTVDPQIKAAFRKELGLFGPIFEYKLHNVAKRADVQILKQAQYQKEPSKTTVIMGSIKSNSLFKPAITGSDTEKEQNNTSKIRNTLG